ncbi:MAG TPA: molecular chaperone DnaK, partial [Candidatus Pacearchaeota archaeon]|nr:molecular chaperone DnaK [Candidatus Pacearchaeota archaeon]
DAGDKIKEENKKEIETKIEELKKVKDSDNIDEIKNKTKDLSDSIQKIGAELYQEAQEKKEENKEEKKDNNEPEEGEYKEE